MARFCLVADRGMISKETMKTLEEHERRLAICTQCQGTCGKVFQAVVVA